MSKDLETISRRAIARLKFRDMQVFLLVVRFGSMAKAAQFLSLTQSAISQSIAEIEHVLGYRLLERGPKGVTPTIYGSKLLERVSEIFDSLDSGVRDLDFLSRPGTGLVRIGADMSFIASGLLSEIINDVENKFPQIRLDIIETTTKTAKPDYKELRDRSVDLIIGRISNEAPDNELNVETLFEESMFVITGKNSSWAKSRGITLHSLKDAKWILASIDNMARSLVQNAFESQKIPFPEPQITTYSMQLRMQLLQERDYVTVMSETGFQYSRKNWALHKLPVDLKKKLPVAVLTLRQRSLPMAAETFMRSARDIAKRKRSQS